MLESPTSCAVKLPTLASDWPWRTNLIHMTRSLAGPGVLVFLPRAVAEHRLEGPAVAAAVLLDALLADDVGVAGPDRVAALPADALLALEARGAIERIAGQILARCRRASGSASRAGHAAARTRASCRGSARVGRRDRIGCRGWSRRRCRIRGRCNRLGLLVARGSRVAASLVGLLLAARGEQQQRNGEAETGAAEHRGWF